MGEGQNLAQLREVLQIVRCYGLKTCLYSGCECVESFHDLLPLLDYLKLGEYRPDNGGLDSANTNQRFYRVINSA
jgi:anaerobic ribonucleoside-triphosphate reductase activating protein